MYQFCEFPAGSSEKICGGRVLGRCYMCGRSFCSIHGRISENKMICWDCLESANEYRKEAERLKEEALDRVYLEPHESFELNLDPAKDNGNSY